jgi:hypothetical protein
MMTHKKKIITVKKIGNGTMENPFRPNTKAKWWEVIEDEGDKFKIVIIKESSNLNSS